ncbi:hypothetical protein Taro_021590 [Colocasia esculenta]|uniref:Protein TIFY n=1 Tax=Colocasia esculenta TaxID=4460 RepID=A0A843UZH1_COLES|nr:hypothetical protein [Colocasia esculenta]
MSKSAAVIDFFHIEKQNASAKPPPPPPASPPGRTAGAPFRGIQSLVSRINPQLLKTVMAASRPAGTRPPPHSSSPSSPTVVPLPVLNPAASRGSTAASQLPTETAPLTIFYNGTVAAFDVPRDQAEVIIKMVETGITSCPAPRKESSSSSSLADGGQLEGDLPIARRKSLQRFLEKRKGRLATASPYHEGTTPPQAC